MRKYVIILSVFLFGCIIDEEPTCKCDENSDIIYSKDYSYLYGAWTVIEDCDYFMDSHSVPYSMLFSEGDVDDEIIIDNFGEKNEPLLIIVNNEQITLPLQDFADYTIKGNGEFNADTLIIDYYLDYANSDSFDEMCRIVAVKK